MGGGLNLNIDWAQHRWAIFYCLVATIGALCYGYDVSFLSLSLLPFLHTVVCQILSPAFLLLLLLETDKDQKTIYYTGIQGMKYFARDYGTLDADGTYSLGTTFLSVSASIIYVGEFVGALIAAPINDKFGRKAVFASAAICIIIGAIVQVCAYSIEGVFYVGRIFVGLGVGQFTATCLVYVADVAPSPIRGPALMMFQFMQSIAQFVGACVNQGTETIDGKAQYQLPMGLLTALPLTMLVLLIFTPESPVWFMSKDRRDDARKALIKINRSTTAYDPETDLKIIDDQIALDRELAAGSSWISLITDPIERRKLIYACGVMFAQQVRFPFLLLLLLLDTKEDKFQQKKTSQLTSSLSRSTASNSGTPTASSSPNPSA